MVNKIISLFQKKLSGLHEAAYLLALFAFLSQLMAVVRDRLLAHNFGAGEMLDIYYAAFRIPDLIYVSIASFVAVTVLIPFLLERLEDSKEKAQRFLNAVFTTFLAAIILVCFGAFLLMPFLAHVVAPGFDEAARETLVSVSRILLLSPILLGISNLLGSVTQLYKKFFVFALGPVLYNIGIILGLLFLEPYFGLMGVVMGVVLGAVCHMAIQLPVVGSSHLIPKFRPSSVASIFNAEKNTNTYHENFEDKQGENESETEGTDTSRPAASQLQMAEVKEVVKTSFPRTVSLSITQIVIFILISIASLLSVGAISVFQLSHNLQSVPLAIIGMSYSVAAFPTLAAHFSKGETRKFKNQMKTATKHIIFWSLPAVVLFIVLRAQIVRVVFGSGEFTWSDTRLTAAALALFAVSVTAQSLVLLYARGYYATGNTRTPLVVNAISALLIILLAFGFVFVFQNAPTFRFFVTDLLRVDGISGTVVLMLPLAFSIGMTMNALTLIRRFKKDFPIDFREVTKSFRQGLLGAITMGAVAYLFLGYLDDFFDINTFFGIFAQGAIAGTFGIISGVLLLWVIDNKEIKVVGRTLHKKFWRARTIGASKEDLS